MTPAVPRLSNAAARRLFLHRHLLGTPPQGPGRGDDLLSVIDRLGFVQVDSVQTVARAHHMILFARRASYRPRHLTPLIERDRALFEHWTHDAAIVPTDLHPHWRLRFARDSVRLIEKWRRWRGDAYREELDRVLDRVTAEGPLSASDFAEAHRDHSGGGWWNWHPSKAALEFLWRTGVLAVSGRRGFQKIYDLGPRVLPDAHARPTPPPEISVEWFNAAALDRLGFATSGRIAAFWAHVTPAEASDWCATGVAAGRLTPLLVEGADGRTRRMVARPDAVAEAAMLPPPPARLRILSPFDPALRDRARAEFLFGFRYRIEIFVPAAKRQYGYYVFPILEGDRLIGRIDMRADREALALVVRKLWLEPGVGMSAGRRRRLEAELARMARFAGLDDVTLPHSALSDLRAP